MLSFHVLYTLLILIPFINSQPLPPKLSSSISTWKQVLQNSSSFYELACNETGLSRSTVSKKIRTAINSYSNPSKLSNCSNVKEDFSGLCKVNNQVVYMNENRAPFHTFRTFALPTLGIGTSIMTFGIHKYVCFNKGSLINPLVDFSMCNFLDYYALYNQIITVGWMALGYKELTGSPFSYMSVRILNLFRSLGFTYKGFSAVGENDEVVPLNEMPPEFPLKYIFLNYGDPRSRNASLAMFLGNNRNEVGLSFISKPWDANSDSNLSFDVERFDWKYVLKMDLDEVNFQLDQISPEEFYYGISKNTLNFKDFLLFGGGLWSNGVDIHVSLDNPDEQENKALNEDEQSTIDSEKFYTNLHGFKIRVSLEKQAVHTVDW